MGCKNMLLPLFLALLSSNVHAGSLISISIKLGSKFRTTVYRSTCLCPPVYAPVCSESGKTYVNHCHMLCAGETFVDNGYCTGSSCNCPRISSPVCGVRSGMQYNNLCEAKCAGERHVTEGACKTPCDCSNDEIPVCGVDGNTYLNACYAACSGVEVESGVGRCGDVKVECFCQDPPGQRPICARPGVTFASPCVAQCEGYPGPYGNGPCSTDTILPESCEMKCGLAGHQPVCAVRSGTETRETFENACTAKCAKATVVKLSACDDANGQTCSFCPKDAGGKYCLDGKDFTSVCEARCQGLEPAGRSRPGRCDPNKPEISATGPDFICPSKQNTVCGTAGNGVRYEYQNRCYLDFIGASFAGLGSCDSRRLCGCNPQASSDKVCASITRYEFKTMSRCDAQCGGYVFTSGACRKPRSRSRSSRG